MTEMSTDPAIAPITAHTGALTPALLQAAVAAATPPAAAASMITWAWNEELVPAVVEADAGKPV